MAVWILTNDCQYNYMIGIADFIANRLAGSFWHTTSVARFESILATGSIMVEPGLPEKERYGGGPFVRSLGGVSLFDFPAGFDFEKYDVEIPTNSLGEFVPFKRVWGQSVWLRLDTDTLAQGIRSGKAIRALWKELGSARRFIPEVEGAHLGDIPIGAIKDAYQIGDGDADWTCLNHALRRSAYLA